MESLPPMPSEPPPPPPDEMVMGGRGKTEAAPLPGSFPLERKMSWRRGNTKSSDAAASATEEDYGFDTTTPKPKGSTISKSKAANGRRWAAIVEKDAVRPNPSPRPMTLQQSLSIQQKLVAGGVSRAISQCVLYPVDALRTLAQTRDHRTLADVGVKTLFSGCVTTSSFALFIGSIQFGIFGATRNMCGPVIASALGAAGSCVVSIPQEVIKQRLVTNIYSGFRDACTTIYKKEGMKGFYSAWAPTMGRNIPFVVATFSSNDYMKQKIIKRRRLREGKNWAGDAGGADPSNELTIAENLIVGISSAMVGAILTHPCDVVKTRMMTQGASAEVPYKSAIDCVATMLKTEGLPSFYSGFAQRSVYMGPLWAMQFALNGRICKSLEERNNNKKVADGAGSCV